jgi:hypothetical protein
LQRPKSSRCNTIQKPRSTFGYRAQICKFGSLQLWKSRQGTTPKKKWDRLNETIKIAPLHKLAFAAAARAPGIIGLPRRLRAIAAVFLPTSRQLTADRARRAMQKLADQPLTAAPIMLG